MKLNLCVKKPDKLISYNIPTPLVIGKETVNFHPKILLKEVSNLPKKEKKKFQLVARSFLMTTISFLSLSSKSMAETLGQPNTVLVNNSSMTAGVGLPPELLHFGMQSITIVVGGGILLAALLLASAGIMKMLGKKRRKEAEEWTTDIIKGAVQVLLSVPVIMLIYYLTSLLLGSSGFFISPF